MLCTPIADAGFPLDFPLRILFGIRMIISEIAVWVVAIALNVITTVYFPEYYNTTVLTQLMQKIIATPYPYWTIVILSGIGTFLSIRFGDELMDVVHNRDRSFFHSHRFKHELIMLAFLCMILLGYYDLMSSLGFAASI